MTFARWLLAFVLLTTRVGSRRSRKETAARALPEASRAMGEHRYDEAAAIYREMLKVTPDEPELLANLGMALAMGGHDAEAVPPLERAVALNPKLTNARVVLGSSYLAIGEPSKAIATLQAGRLRATVEHRESPAARRGLRRGRAARGCVDGTSQDHADRAERAGWLVRARTRIQRASRRTRWPRSTTAPTIVRGASCCSRMHSPPMAG